MKWLCCLVSLYFFFFLESFICITILKGISLNLRLAFTFFFSVLEDTSGSLTCNSCRDSKTQKQFFYISARIKEEGRVAVLGHLAAAGDEINAQLL